MTLRWGGALSLWLFFLDICGITLDSRGIFVLFYSANLHARWLLHTRWLLHGLCGSPLGKLRASLLERRGEHRVHQAGVSLDCLLGEALGSLGSALLLVDQLLSHLPVVLCLSS